MPRRRFVIFDALGAMLWVGVYVGLGYALHDQLAQAALLADRLGGWAIVIVASVFALYLGVKVTRRYLFIRRLRISRISPEEPPPCSAATTRTNGAPASCRPQRFPAGTRASSS